MPTGFYARSAYRDMEGKKFGLLTVLSVAQGRRSTCLCQCDCGGQKVILAASIKSGNTQSCGCLNRTAIDLTNMRFGKLVAVRRGDNIGHIAGWVCQCDCGSVAHVSTWNLRAGHTTSCGCKLMDRSYKRTHGGSHLRAYESWRSMLRRCYNPKDMHYRHYGARGIVVCDRWHSFERFLKDMGDRQKGWSIERIDVNGNYCPKNCKWIPQNQQARNTRQTPRLTIDGDCRTVREWCEHFGIKHSCYKNRRQRGLSPIDALTRPLFAHTPLTQ